MLKSKNLFKLVIAIIILIAIVIYINDNQKSRESKCCSQCAYASTQDIRAFDTKNELCNSAYYTNSETYTNQKIYTIDCLKFFEKNPKRVFECKNIVQTKK